MSTDRPRSPTRRRILQMLGVSGALAATGTSVGASGTSGRETDDEDRPSLEPGPEAEPLTEADLQALVEVFDDRPMNDDQFEIEGTDRTYTPRHVWKWVSNDTLIALHLNEPNPEEATAIDYVVIGQKDAFTEASQPNLEFSHFHQRDADGWEAGHGGDVGDEGYWLTHIAARELEYPFHDDPIDPGVDYGFMPTPPADGSEGTADFDVDGQGGLSEDDRNTLLEVFDDRPMNGDQFEIEGEHSAYTPSHLWKWLTDDVLMFLHVDEPNPEEAETLMYFGIGTRGQFRADDRPDSNPELDDEDFAHFHKWEAESWEAGHGAQSEDQHGYWLIHHAVRPLEMPWGDVEVGVDREFMPTPLDGEETAETEAKADEADVDKENKNENENENENDDVADRTGQDLVEIETRAGVDDEPEFVFDPDTVRVDAGTTIQWLNTDGVFHTVTATDSLENRTPSEEFDATISSQGDTVEWDADDAGTQHYYCQPHAGFMYGTIEIE